MCSEYNAGVFGQLAKGLRALARERQGGHGEQSQRLYRPRGSWLVILLFIVVSLLGASLDGCSRYYSSRCDGYRNRVKTELVGSFYRWVKSRSSPPPLR